MKEWLDIISFHVVVLIDAIAMIVIVIGTIEAVISGAKLALSPSTGREQREVWLRYARWLVAGLTFQLAADIIETSISPGWTEIGRLGAIAIIRTGLNYFLERDLEEVRVRQKEVREKA